MTNQAIPSYTQQRRSAVFLPVVLLVNLIHYRLELSKQFRGAFLQFADDRLEQPLGHSFGEFEHDIADKSIANNDIDDAFEQIAAFDVADEINLGLIAKELARF